MSELRGESHVGVAAAESLRAQSPIALSRGIGLVLGPVLAVVLWLLLPAEQRGDVGQVTGPMSGGLSGAGRMTIAIGAWLAVWWITEAIAIEAAALLPLALFPIAGVATMRETAAPYADEVVYLFLGGMLLGAAMERWGLHRRVALLVMLALGTRPPMLIGGILLATAIISMGVSNTAAAIMMLPIAVGVVNLTHARHEAGGASREDAHARHFAISAMLAVAYGASIGGVATIIGSPPNGVTVGFIKSQYGEAITFGRWLSIGLPVMLVTLPVAWGLLLLLYPLGRLRVSEARELLREQLRELGPVSRGEGLVLGVFGCAALAWIFRVPLSEALGLVRTVNGKSVAMLTDAGVAILAALALFVIPVRWSRAEFVLDWRTAGKIPWGVLLLFGGGLSLAAAVDANGVDDYAAKFFEGLKGLHPVVVLAMVAAAAVFVSEIGSNTAVATVMLPIMATAAPGLGVHPYALCFAIALGVSLAFMMPSGTPPNALVFTSGHLRVKHMVRSGLALNVCCVVIITIACWVVARTVGW